MVDTMINLFESTSVDFETNGLGSLPDAVSCLVIEERNGEYELELTYPITGKRYSELLMRRIIVSKSNPYSEPQPFRIYAITKPIDGIVTVNAEHISYDLSGYPVSPFTAGSAVDAFVKMKEASTVACPFSFLTDKTTSATMDILRPASMRSVLGGVDGSILDVYGGEYEFNKFSVNLWNHRGANRGVSIRYGKNLTDLKQEENCSAVYTGVYPFWCSEQDGLMLLSEKIVKVEGTYDFTRIYPLDLSQEWQDKPTEEQLRTMAKIYMKLSNIGVPTVNLTVSFAQIAQSEEYKDIAILETVHLCDTVNVEFPELKVSATAKCIRTEYDALTGKYNKLELGEAKSNLASTISSQNHIINETPNKTFLEQAIENATQLITGGLGGHVVMHSSTGGRYPDEILIMDTDDIKTAIKVWRWNKGGLGYSGTGYMGPYGTAITADGRIVANFITAGKFNGALIKANTILASALSIEYTNSVTREIDGKIDDFNTGALVETLRQTFVAENGVFRSEVRKEVTSGVTPAINAARDAKSAADAAQSSADTGLKNISDIISDSKLTPNEKTLASKEWATITAEYGDLQKQQKAFNISCNYESTYTELQIYITPLLANMSGTSEIVAATYKQKFVDYYTARQNLLNKIAEITKSTADTANNTANTAAENYTKIEQDYNSIKQTVGTKMDKTEFKTEFKQTSTAFDFELGAENDTTHITKNGIEVKHLDGSFTKISSQGLTHKLGAAEDPYHYLCETGIVTSGVVVDYTYTLPAEFKGKDFKVITAIKDLPHHTVDFGNNDIRDMSVYSAGCTIKSIDRENGKFTVSTTSVYGFYSSDGRWANSYGSLPFSFIAIA